MSLWVLGTDTGVGKTIVSALILNRYGSRGGLSYWKPVSTGGDQDRDRSTVCGLLDPRVGVLDETYLFELSASPHLAARREGAEIDPQRILGDLARHREQAGDILIEGAGGVMVPLTDRGDLFIDTVAATALPAVLVARSTLGTINHTLLTLEALRSRGIEVLGVVLNGPPDAENSRAIQNLGETVIVSEVAPLAETQELSRETVLRAAADFDPRGILADHLRGTP